MTIVNKLVAVSLIFSLMLTACQESSHGEEGTNNEEKETVFQNVPDLVKQQISLMATSYFDLKNGLVNSDVKASQNAAKTLLEKMAMSIDKVDWDEEQQLTYKSHTKSLQKDLEYVSNSEDIEHQREVLPSITASIKSLLISFQANSGTVYYQYCPMAFDNEGAYWLSQKEEIRNPYFGDAMLKCGSVKEKL